ncbi:glycine--tRNA ligase subunit beta, partial [Planktothrix sp.]|uniref:glycine--tRNA ligase subunit beta n=1 Tax=Planktothrix sp. TaxID=3088171 RepID=UPI0038D47EF3
KSDRISQGHRVLHPEPITISDAKTYAESLRKGFIEVDPQLRIQRIQEDIKTVADRLGGQAEIPEDLLAEVVHLVEWPTAVVGTFDQELLNLPADVIKTVMVSHQRYFPVLTSEPQNSSPLKPYFITISNG